jgi:23S rRNA G2445 N2-methylase RlmL
VPEDRVFALTTRGLEDVSADEMRQLPGLKLDEIGYRRITASASDLRPLLDLRTVDDVYLELAIWDGIGHTRAVLPHIQDRAADLDLIVAADAIDRLRPIPLAPVFSVTASFVGQRNFSSDEIKQRVADGIARSLGWDHVEDDRAADLNVRVFIEHDVGWVGARLARSPQHDRLWKRVQMAGSLKATVAAAMIRLAGRPGLLLDPCCGAGTIPIEACLWGLSAVGGDPDPASLTAAAANAGAASIDLPLLRADASVLPLADETIAQIVTNLPWGRQVSAPAGFYAAISPELARVLIPGGRIVALMNAPDLLALPGLHLIDRREISLFGQRPAIRLYEKPR